jgi:hypothetical protein
MDESDAGVQATAPNTREDRRLKADDHFSHLVGASPKPRSWDDDDEEEDEEFPDDDEDLDLGDEEEDDLFEDDEDEDLDEEEEVDEEE